MGKKQQQKSVPRTTTITPASTTTTLKSFSPSTSSSKSSLPPLYYAHLLRAPDAHTLRVYETSTGKCISRWASNQLGDEDEEHEQRVASLEWTLIPAPLATTSNAESVEQSAEAEGKRGKKRRKSDSTPVAPLAPSVQQQAEPKLVLALGLENGSILLWSPNGANPTTLSHPSSSTPVTALASPIVAGQSSAEATSGHLWSAHEDGSVRVWDLVSGQLMGKANGVTEGKKWDDLAVRYEAAEASDKKRSVQIVLSHLSLHVYSLSILTGASKKDKVKDLKATEVGRCTGHVEAAFVRWTGRSATSSSTSAMEEDASTSLSFLSYSPADRFIQFWSLALSSTTSTRAEGSLVARLALDSGVHSVALGASASPEEEQIVAGIDSVGKVALARLPFVFPQATAAKGKKAGVLALEVESEVSGKGGDAAGVSEVAFGAEAQLVVCRGGVKPTFESVSFVDDTGSWTTKIELEKAGAGLLSASADEDAGAPAPSRYSEVETSAVRSAEAVAEPNSDDEDFANSGELDVDMAEPTLADRLKAMNVSKLAAQAGDDAAGSDDDDAELSDDAEELAAISSGPTVPATTLSTTLIQALHSSDAPLLESCLSHTSAPLIRSTVKRLPSGSLVLGLLEALVERLGTGKKGAQGNASVKRARGLIEWVRQVLVVHVGFLVTIPSLVNRLATLHASLTSRLALQPTLIALNGRLELVMSQIDLRQERAAQRAELAAAAPKATSGGRKYVEGESDESGSEDEDDEDEDMEGEEFDDEGSVEDVVLGSGDEEEMESDDEVDDDGMGFEDDEEDSEGEEQRPKVNGRGGIKMGVASMLDLEASEDDSEGEDEEEEESDEDSE